MIEIDNDLSQILLNNTIDVGIEENLDKNCINPLNFDFNNVNDNFLDPDYFLASMRNANIPTSKYEYSDCHLRNMDLKNAINILSWNSRSVPLNFQTLIDNSMIDEGVYDIISLCETRLDEAIASVHERPNYSMYNQFRNRLGGGVCMYVKDTTKSSQVTELCFMKPFMTCLTVELEYASQKFVAVAIYRPPSGNFREFMQELNKLLSKLDKRNYDEIFLMGDLNVNLLNENAPSTIELTTSMLSHSLFPVISKATRVVKDSATLIDHIWTSDVFNNSHNFIYRYDITDHYAVNSIFEHPRVQNRDVKVYKRIFNENNKTAFMNEISEVTWDNVYSQRCVNMAYKEFEVSFLNIYNKNFPVKKVTKRHKHLRSPYITLGLQTSIKERRRLQRLADKYPLTYGEHYKKYRNKLNKLLKEANQNYYKNQFKDSQGNIKETWGHINSLMGRKKKSGNNDIQMPVNSCEPLADYINNL